MPRERTKPPTTAVKRVDFFLQNVMTSGERRRETPKHNPDKQPRIKKWRKLIHCFILNWFRVTLLKIGAYSGKAKSLLEGKGQDIR